MHTFKVGEKVKWQGNGGVEYGVIKVPSTTYAVVSSGKEIYYFDYLYLFPAEGFYPMVGDTVKGFSEHELKVIGVCGDVFFTQCPGTTPWSWDRLACEQAGGIIIGQTTKKVTLTVPEIEQKLGLEKGSLEVKS